MSLVLQSIEDFREVWFWDFEFSTKPGELPEPICMVAFELHTGRCVKLRGDQLKTCPFEVARDVLFVAYYAIAEVSCHLALDWPLPMNVLDLFVEFRNSTNGRRPKDGAGLVGALRYHGLPCIDASQKQLFRELAVRGEPYTAEEQQQLLEYCESDCISLLQLFNAMHSSLDGDLPRALQRGAYMRAAATVEQAGVPPLCQQELRQRPC